MFNNPELPNKITKHLKSKVDEFQDKQECFDKKNQLLKEANQGWATATKAFNELKTEKGVIEAQLAEANNQLAEVAAQNVDLQSKLDNHDVPPADYA